MTNPVLWLVQRISGAILAVVLVIHIWVMHFSTESGKIDFNTAMQRLSQPYWKWLYGIFLFFVLLHGMAGFRLFLFDYGFSKKKRSLISALIILLGAALLYIGLKILFFVS